LASGAFDSSLAGVSADFCPAGFWGLASATGCLEAYNLAIFFSYAFEGASWFSSGKLVKICLVYT
jgi:hypothetical protein